MPIDAIISYEFSPLPKKTGVTSSMWQPQGLITAAAAWWQI
jgi:hypothetical protein